MYNPEDVYTKDGLADYQLTVHSLEKNVFKLINDADDLHLESNEEVYDALIVLHNNIDFLKNGDGETLED